jgi:hypothetical protein
MSYSPDLYHIFDANYNFCFIFATPIRTSINCLCILKQTHLILLEKYFIIFYFLTKLMMLASKNFEIGMREKTSKYLELLEHFPRKT